MFAGEEYLFLGYEDIVHKRLLFDDTCMAVQWKDKWKHYIKVSVGTFYFLPVLMHYKLCIRVLSHVLSISCCIFKEDGKVTFVKRPFVTFVIAHQSLVHL